MCVCEIFAISNLFSLIAVKKSAYGKNDCTNCTVMLLDSVLLIVFTKKKNIQKYTIFVFSELIWRFNVSI